MEDIQNKTQQMNSSFLKVRFSLVKPPLFARSCVTLQKNSTLNNPPPPLEKEIKGMYTNTLEEREKIESQETTQQEESHVESESSGNSPKVGGFTVSTVRIKIF